VFGFFHILSFTGELFSDLVFVDFTHTKVMVFGIRHVQDRYGWSIAARIWHERAGQGKNV
jgi:hypothetical protein